MSSTPDTKKVRKAQARARKLQRALNRAPRDLAYSLARAKIALARLTSTLASV